MPTNHYAYNAVPATGATAALRSGLVGRVAYCLSGDEDSRDLVAIDPDTGDVIPAIIQNGHVYGLDNTDTTTAHDGVICLVSYDSKRYKLDDLKTPYAVLSKSLTAPPESPAIGDAYLLDGVLTGDWAGKSGYITIFTARGWEFALPPVGFRILVEDEGTVGVFYFRDHNGDWQAGIGGVTLGPESVPLSAIIGAAGSLTIRVQNQSTNSPPVTASVGVAYIIGPSPTGAWAGHAAKVAICELEDTFTIYAPAVGDQVYDISAGQMYRWSGAAWRQASGNFKIVMHFYSSSGTWTKPEGCFGVFIRAIGGGGGGAGAVGPGGAGGASAFGGKVAGGGAGGTLTADGAGGLPSGGADVSMWGLAGSSGSTTIGGNSPGPLGSIVDPTQAFGRGGGSETHAGGGGAYFEHWFPADVLADTEPVAVGPFGGAGAGTGGIDGHSGGVWLQEYIRV